MSGVSDSDRPNLVKHEKMSNLEGSPKPTLSPNKRKLSASKSSEENPRPVSSEPYSIVESVKNLVNCKDLSDVTFIVGANKKLIYAHKVILSLGSPVFKQMFYGEFPQSSDAIEISDLTEAGFTNMLLYIYSNKIDFDLSQVYESYKSLDKYLVHGFQEKLLGHIENNLNKSNCCIIFDQLLKIEKENVCLDFIESFIKVNSSAALHSDSFLQIDLHSLIRLLNFDYLNVSEFEILEACARWVHAKLKKSNKKPSWQNVRKEFEEIRSLIKFTDLTVDELGKMPEKPELRNILSYSELGSLFFYLRDKTTKPTIECQTNRLTVQPFVTEDQGVYHDSTCRESFTTRELYSNRRILISSIFTFIDTAFEANLSITNVQTKEEIKLEIERESNESKWVFHLRPHLEICPTQRYSIKFAIKSIDSIRSLIMSSRKEFYYKRDGTDYQCTINVSSLNDCYYDYNYHFIRKIAFYDCS